MKPSPLPAHLSHLSGLGAPYVLSRDLRGSLLSDRPAGPSTLTYDQAFALEAERIEKTIDGPHRFPVRHVGSTAVWGLPANPVLDILVPQEAGPDMLGLGYTATLKSTLGHAVFVLNWTYPGHEKPRCLVVAHIAPAESTFAKRSLLVRDVLRSEAKWLKYYDSMRRTLLEKCPECYRTSKAQFFDYLWAFHS